MRQICAVLVLFGFLSVGFGCNHMAGVCDCAGGPAPHLAPPPPPTVAPPVAQPEPIKVMPKTDKEKKAPELGELQPDKEKKAFELGELQPK
jgi:hypothetical protein